jgi:carboxymethylenebutenolidase
MADDTKDRKENDESSSGLPRRDFVMSVAAGLAAAGAASGAPKIVETDVEIKTPDGTCDAAFIHPASGSHPGVLIWPDAFGLRPSMREMAKRLAAEGYSVLVPNPFYRMGKAPFWTDASTVNFQAEGGKIRPLMASVNAAGNAEKDAVAYIGFLDEQKQVNKKKKIGTQGYCMGGALVMRTAATLPDRVGAGGSFHGGGLVSRDPSASAGAEDQGQDVFRNRDERRQDATGREGEAQRGVHSREQSG